MSDYQNEYINYRLQKSDEALDDAKLLFNNKSFSACVNRLYYASYYIVSSLLLNAGIKTQTHAGLKTQFYLHFVKTGKISMDTGKIFSDLMNLRQQGDYGDMYDFDEQTVEELLVSTATFIKDIKELF